MRFVLRVDSREIRGELAQHGYRGRLIVDEDAALAARRNLATQDDGFVIFVVGVDAVGFEDSSDDLFRAAPSISKTAEITARSAPERMTSRGGLLAEQQGERVNQNGFARLRFRRSAGSGRQANSTARLSMTA